VIARRATLKVKLDLTPMRPGGEGGVKAERDEEFAHVDRGATGKETPVELLPS